LLAHQTSQIEPSTGIFKTTSRKKIGQNPVTRVSVREYWGGGSHPDTLPGKLSRG
jgi:hypothetical protein